MKNILFLISLSAFTTGTFGQGLTVENYKQDLAQENNEKQFACPKGDYCSPKEGKCPQHFINLIAEGTFYCDIDLISNEVGGKCPICGKEMKKIECKGMPMRNLIPAPTETKKDSLSCIFTLSMKI